MNRSLNASLCGILLLCSLLFVGGCNNTIANWLSEAQNFNSPMRGQDAPQQVLAAHHVASQLRIHVGPPDATLSVWIVEPIFDHGYVSIVSDKTGTPVVTLETRPQTRPAARSPKGTLFLLHGLSQDKELPQYEFYSLLYASQGYRIVLVDLPGHGRSTGDRLGYGSSESRDLAQTLDALQNKGQIVGHVGVIGVSYGGAVAICWAAIDPRVRAVVSLEPFSDLRSGAVDGVSGMLGIFRWMYSDRDLQDIATRVAELGNFDPEKDSPLAAIAKMKTPVLLIHGTADTWLHPAHSIRLHNAALDHSRLILIDEANHLDLWYKGMTTITSATNDWFTKYLDAPTTRPAS